MEENNNGTGAQSAEHGMLSHKVALITHFSQINKLPQTRYTVEGYLVIIVLRGEVSITVEGTDYMLRAGDIFSCVPRNVVEHPSMSADFDARIIYLSPDFAECIGSKVQIDWTFSMMTKRHEILHAETDDLNIMLRYFDLAKLKYEAPDSDFKMASFEMFFASMVYQMFEIRSKAGRKTIPLQQYSAAENLLQRFVKLLNDSGHRMRSVNEYAASLCVSSKYFSSVCKQLTGKPASELINDDIIRSAELMLTDHTKNLKQIADALNFKNQSHFGTFFRRHVGMSPQQYRDSYRRQQQ